MRQSLLQSLYAKKSKQEPHPKGRRLSVYEKLSRLQEENPPEQSGADKVKVKKKGLINNPLQKKGKPIGFWCIPVGDNYLKVPILDFYTMDNEALPDVKKLSWHAGTSYLPIWPLLFNADTFAKSEYQKHFPAFSEWYEGSFNQPNEWLQGFLETDAGKALSEWYEKNFKDKVKDIKDFLDTVKGKEMKEYFEKKLGGMSRTEKFLGSVEGQSLLDSRASDHIAQRARLQKAAMDDGMAFVIISDAQKDYKKSAGKRAMIGSAGGDFTQLKYWEQLKTELMSRDISASNIAGENQLDANNLLYVAQVNAEGSLTKKVMVDDFKDMVPEEAQENNYVSALASANSPEDLPPEILYDSAKLFKVLLLVRRQDPQLVIEVLEKLKQWTTRMKPEQSSEVDRAISQFAYKFGIKISTTPEKPKGLNRVSKDLGQQPAKSSSPPAKREVIPPRIKKKLPPPDLRTAESLIEMSFKQLWALTQSNGSYKYGGMKKVGNSWIYDVTVPGRISNGTRFVVTRPPKVNVAADGNPQIVFNVKSKTDRSTTGLRQTGYVKFVFKTVKGQQSTSTRRSEWGKNVHVFCSCPDFKFRWHKVLFDAGASHEPKGGFEATNAHPSKTNPSGRLSLCKHLVAVSKYLSMSQRDMARYFDEIDKIEKAGLEPDDKGGAPTLDPGSTPNVNPF